MVAPWLRWCGLTVSFHRIVSWRWASAGAVARPGENRVYLVDTKGPLSEEALVKHVQEFEKPTERKATSLGSGFVIKKNGTVITNNHVIANAEDITVSLFPPQASAATIVNRGRSLFPLPFNTKWIGSVRDFGPTG